MKNLIIGLLTTGICLIVFPTFAQLIKQKESKSSDWYNTSFENDTQYGASINSAYDLLKTKKIKKHPIVALIGAGVDLNHEDLKGAFWINPKEKSGDKDIDKNGWKGDIHGWNFLGSKDGKSVDITENLGDREYVRLKEKYQNLVFDGKQYFKYDPTSEKLVSTNPPENVEEYNYFRNQVVYNSQIGSSSEGLTFLNYMGKYMLDFDKELDKKFPESRVHTLKEFSTLYDPTAPKDSLREVAFAMTSMAFSVLKTENWTTIKEYMPIKPKELNIKKIEKFYRENDMNTRIQVGDNPYNISEKGYGNPHLASDNMGLGNLLAGIIAAKKRNGIGIDGIIPEAKLMPLRILPTKGAAYYKDVALAIRYAVDQKADIILLNYTTNLYPKDQGEWIDDALSYASKNNVLVIIPVKDLSYNLDKTTFYPKRDLLNGKNLKNIITVGASDIKGNPLINSNYGKESVDIFAPGVDVKSTFSGNTYRNISSSEAAAATTTGVCALIKAYFPDMSAIEIRQAVLENVTSRKGQEVEKGMRKTTDGREDAQVMDLIPFEELCSSSGIINAELIVKALLNK